MQATLTESRASPPEVTSHTSWPQGALGGSVGTWHLPILGGWWPPTRPLDGPLCPGCTLTHRGLAELTMKTMETRLVT